MDEDIERRQHLGHVATGPTEMDPVGNSESASLRRQRAGIPSADDHEPRLANLGQRRCKRLYERGVVLQRVQPADCPEHQLSLQTELTADASLVDVVGVEPFEVEAVVDDLDLMLGDVGDPRQRQQHVLRGRDDVVR